MPILRVRVERKGEVIRLWIERSTGHAFPNDRRVPGVADSFYDATREPMGSVVAGRPVHVLIEEDGEPEQMPEQKKPPYCVPSMAEIAAMPWNGLTAVSTFSGCGGSSLGYRMAGFRMAWASEFIDAARESYRANAAAHTVLDGRDIRQVQPEDILEATGMERGEIDLFDGSPPCASFSTAGKREKHWGKAKAYSDKAQRTDDLFFEFARLVDGTQPRTFVAENVSGLVKGTAKGYFKRILARLRGCGYRVEAKLLDAQWLGVPQARQRLIFVGVRRDLDAAPAFPKPLRYRYSVREALPWIERVLQGRQGNYSKLGEELTNGPCKTVLGTQPLQFDVEGPLVESEADISRFEIGKEWDRMGKPGTQSDRFFQLVRPDPAGPSPTITAAGGTSSLAAVTPPTERRKFSIAELRRICGFPDDFILTGSYAQQWERLGRAVPPVMMSHIAAAVRDGPLAGRRR